VHHLDSWVKRDHLDVTCFIISLFNAQHVSDVNTSETCWALNKEIIKQVTPSWSLLTQISYVSFTLLFTVIKTMFSRYYALKSFKLFEILIWSTVIYAAIARLLFSVFGWCSDSTFSVVPTLFGSVTRSDLKTLRSCSVPLLCLGVLSNGPLLTTCKNSHIHSTQPSHNCTLFWVPLLHISLFCGMLHGEFPLHFDGRLTVNYLDILLAFHVGLFRYFLWRLLVK